MSAAGLLNRFGSIESFPREVLGERRPLALLFKSLATLRTDKRLFANVEELQLDVAGVILTASGHIKVDAMLQTMSEDVDWQVRQAAEELLAIGVTEV